MFHLLISTLATKLLPSGPPLHRSSCKSRAKIRLPSAPAVVRQERRPWQPGGRLAALLKMPYADSGLHPSRCFTAVYATVGGSKTGPSEIVPLRAWENMHRAHGARLLVCVFGRIAAWSSHAFPGKWRLAIFLDERRPKIPDWEAA